MTTYIGGSETLVNTYTTDDQFAPVVTALSGGGYVVTWTSFDQLGDGTSDVFFQRYDASGNPVGAETQANTTTAGSQYYQATTALPGGGFAITYESREAIPGVDGVVVQLFNASGAKVGTEIPVGLNGSDVGFMYASSTVLNQVSTSTAAFVAAFASEADSTNGYNIVIQRASATGALVGSATIVNTTLAGEQTQPKLQGLFDGGFIVVWESDGGQDGDGSGIYMQRYDATGAKVNGETLVNTTTAGSQVDPQVGLLADGGYVITWEGSSNIYEQRYSAAGAKVGGEVQVNTTALSAYVNENVSNPVVTGLADGGYVVAWAGSGGNDASSINLQQYDALGNKVGGEVLVNQAIDGVQDHPSITALVGGGFVVAWQSGGQDGSGIGVYERTFLPGSPPIDGDAKDNTLNGTTGDDTMHGFAGNDLIDGKAGADKMFGGAGDDTYVVDNVGDQVSEQTVAGVDDGGHDTVQSSVSFTLGAFLENLTLTGSGNINATGNGLDNTLTGNGGNNRLDGGAGADHMVGGAGDDTYVVDNTGDTVVEANGGGNDTVLSSVTFSIATQYVETLTLTGTANINATGNGNDNTLNGNAGNNLLNGGVGADHMAGGAGDDTYIVENAGDTVSEGFNQGHDLVQSAISFSLYGQYIEDLTLTGAGNIDGIGNSFDNVITGNTMDNSLVGNDGNDTLNGLAGNDTLTGGAGNDKLDGGLGADKMAGGAGDDTYYVDSAGDTVTEANGGGNDTVYTNQSFVIGSQYIETVILTGQGPLNATGNGLANTLIGNDSNNTLNGGAGADIMQGGKGNDGYYVDNTGDVVTENAGEGTDVVYASITYTLGANLENMILQGSAAIDGTGNTQANVIAGNGAANHLSGLDGNDVLRGNGGNDLLDGGTGNDRMFGGAGNDTYIVDSALDATNEQTVTGTDDGGIDLVMSSVNWQLNKFLENLTLTGTGNIIGTGNNLNNIIIGNSGNNVLNGVTGDDTLTGGAGADTFQFGLGSGKDTITDFSAAQGDKINVDAYHAHATAIITQSGADAHIDLGGGNIITVQNTSATDPNFLSHIIW